MGSSRYERVKLLRRSLYGEVLLCHDRETQEQVVVKTTDLALACQLQQELATTSTSSARLGTAHENVLAEVEAMSCVSAAGGHANVIHMRDYYVTKPDNTLHVVLDYCEGGDLLEAYMPATPEVNEAYDPKPVTTMTTTGHVSLTGMIKESMALAFLVDVAAGLRFLHAHGIAHRDLSLENILLHDGRAIIADFGLCVQQQQQAQAQAPPQGQSPVNPPALAATPLFQCDQSVGKQYYMAPEVVAAAQATLGYAYDPTRADIWSLGVSFFILLTSSPPFERATPSDSGFRFVATRGLQAVFQAWHLMDSVSVPTQDLLAWMLAIDPAQRPSISEVLSHAALQEAVAAYAGQSRTDR